MSGEIIVLIGVPLVAFTVTVIIAHLLGRARHGMVLGALGLIWAGFTGAMFIGMEQASGWDGLGYFIGLILLGAPAGAGLGLGGLVGWLRSGKEIHA